MSALIISCLAVINGAKTVDEVSKTVKAGFGKVLRVRVLSSFVHLERTDRLSLFACSSHG